MNGQPSPLPIPVGAGPRDQGWQVPAVCLVLAAMTFAVFGQTLRHDFVNYDDGPYVYENPMVAQGLTLHGIIRAFTRSHSDNWHPLTWLSHMLDCQLYGLHPGGHHLTNVLLHTATVIALFLVLRQMTGAFWRSAFVAAVFAIHPLRVESVAWVAERKDVLSGLFFMLTIGAYVRYARRPQPAAGYGLVMLLFALGLMSKPMLVTLPVVLLLLDYWPLQRKESVGRLIMEKLPLLALSAASCVVTIWAQRGAIHMESFSLPVRLANALMSGKVYLDQMIYPVRLAVLYPYPHALSSRRMALAGVLLAAISVVAWKERGKQPWLLMGWLWYLVMLVPVSGIIQVGAQTHADRYTYLPQIGIYVAVTWLATEWLHHGPWRVVLGGLMAGVLAVLMVCAWQQTAYWQNSETLWTHTLACTSDNAIAHNNFGTALMDEGKMDEAGIQFQQALQINPNFAEARNNLGNTLMNKGGVDEAITRYQEVLKTQPRYAQAHFNLGRALDQKGRTDEALAQFQQTLQINPKFVEAHNEVGRILCQKGKVDEGIAHFQQALQINPDFVEADNNLGNAFMEKGEVDEAIACYQKALAINPGYAQAQHNLEKAIFQKQRLDNGMAH